MPPSGLSAQPLFSLTHCFNVAASLLFGEQMFITLLPCRIPKKISFLKGFWWMMLSCYRFSGCEICVGVSETGRNTGYLMYSDVFDLDHI